MELLFDTLGWFADPANWTGRDAIPLRVMEHLLISLAAIVAGLLLAMPVGLYIGHTGRGALLAVSLANIGRAVPSYALLVVLFGFFVTATRDVVVFTAGPTLVAMVALAIPPLVTNTYVGLRDVSDEVIEAGRGMGMRGDQLLRRVEIPLALPLILAGLRIASVQVIATAALGGIIGGGGLGRYIVQGITRFDHPRLLAGVVLVSGLAICADLAISWLQRRTVSPGVSVEGERAYEQPGQALAPPGIPG